MTRTLPLPLLAQVGEVVARHTGLHFPPERAFDLERSIRAAAREFGFVDPEDCVRWLLSTRLTPAHVEVLAAHLTVGETYFFRDRRVFDLLETEILPGLIRSRRGGEQRLRLWSAACCTGEEAYSLATCVRQVLPDLQHWRVSIQGTDINARFLHKAAEGVYSDWSFRETTPAFRENCFERVDPRRWRIAPSLRERVTFFPLNLVEDTYPSLLTNTHAVDVIFCRNVLIYFSPKQAARVIQNLSHCLTEGGWLVLAPSEMPHTLPPDLVRVRFPGAILCRKESAATRLVDRVLPEAEEKETPPWSDAVAPDPFPRPFEFPADLPTSEPPAVVEESWYEEARRLYDEGHYPAGANLLTGPASSATPEPRVLALLTRIRANQGRLGEALACCDRLVAADKMNPAAHYLRASLLAEQGNAAEAATAFKRALYLDPDFVLAHFALGNLARQQARLEDASRHFRNALTLARQMDPAAPLPEADGLTARRLVEIIATLQEAEAPPVRS